MIDVRAAGGSLAITGIAGISKLAVQGATATTTGSQTDVFTSMGVFGAALAIAYFMLRRGDKREREMLDTAAKELEMIRADLGAAQRHATEVADKYIAALVEIGTLKAALRARNEGE